MPTISEYQIHRAFVYWYEGVPGKVIAAKLPGVVAWHTPNGGYRDPLEAKRFKEMGVLAGVPDYFMLWGTLYALEFKTLGGRLSGAQIDLHPRLVAAGAKVATAYTLDEAKKIAGAWGLTVDSQRNGI